MFFFQNWFVQVKFHPPFLMLTIKTNTKAQLCASQFCASQFNPPLPHADKKNRSKTCLSSIVSAFFRLWRLVCPSQFYPPFLMLTIKTKTGDLLSGVVTSMFPCFLTLIFTLFLMLTKTKIKDMFANLPSFLTFKDLVCPSQSYPAFFMLTIKTKTRDLLSCVVHSILPFIFRLGLSKSISSIFRLGLSKSISSTIPHPDKNKD